MQNNLETDKKEQIAENQEPKEKRKPPFWYCNVVACIVAIVLMIVEYILGNYSSIYAIGIVCFSWSSLFYFSQYFKVKKRKLTLVVAILEAFGLVLSIVSYILYVVGVL